MNHIQKLNSWLLIICMLLLSLSGVFGQIDQISHRVDSLFSFVKPDQPGYLVGIIKDGGFIYKKGFGLADLSHNIPMSDSSAFYMGSTSKQFTATCLLLLAEQGKINIQDDIRKYLPEIPDYGQPITIEHLLHHTSGIREYTSLMLFSGHDINFEELYTNDDAYYTCWHQKALNFRPGEKYTYSSGGYILLAKIIEKVTGTTLRKFADSILFKPLGMNHTFFHDQHGDIIRNRTESYYPYQNGYRQYIKVFDMVGDGGLITDLNDLVKWDNAFYNEKLGIRDFAEKLSRRYTLSNGSTIPYAWGINNDTYKGLRTLEHGGFMLAYDSDILRFPDQHFTVIVLNNARGRRWTTSLAYTIADMYLLAYETPITRETVTVKTIPSNNKSEKQLAGHYWNINYNYYNEIKFENDTLYFDNTDGWKAVLHHIGKNSYQITGSEIQLFFNGDTMKMRDPASKNPDEEFRKYDPMPPINISEIIPYAGTYYSEELETYYYLKIQGNTATLTINRRPPIQIFPATGNFIWNSKTKIWISIGEITFLKDGLLIGDNRVKGVYFKKLN